MTHVNRNVEEMEIFYNIAADTQHNSQKTEWKTEWLFPMK